MESLKNQIFSISDNIRYVAIYANDKLISGEKPSIKNTSTSESDKYEELIVNPTLLVDEAPYIINLSVVRHFKIEFQ